MTQHPRPPVSFHSLLNEYGTLYTKERIGTKVGALCGEAVVFTKGNRPKHFINSVKKRGAILAKGRLLGIQFDTLFTDEDLKALEAALDK